MVDNCIEMWLPYRGESFHFAFGLRVLPAQQISSSLNSMREFCNFTIYEYHFQMKQQFLSRLSGLDVLCDCGSAVLALWSLIL